MLIKIKPEGKRKEKNVVSSVMTLNILLTFLAYLSDCFKRRQENTKKWIWYERRTYIYKKGCEGRIGLLQQLLLDMVTKMVYSTGWCDSMLNVMSAHK